MAKPTPKQRVLNEWPSAYFDQESREIRRYSEGLPPLGQGRIMARSVENSAWADAAKNIRRADGANLK